MSAPTAAGARADLIKYGRLLGAAYPQLLAAVQVVEARFDYLERVEAAAAAVSETFVQHDYGEGDTIEHLAALAVALEGRTAGS